MRHDATRPRVKVRYRGPTDILGAPRLRIDGHVLEPLAWVIVEFTEAIIRAAAVKLLEVLTLDDAGEEAEKKPRRRKRKTRSK